MEETREVICRNCRKTFAAPLTFYIRKDGRKVIRISDYCSKKCYGEYYKRVTRK